MKTTFFKTNHAATLLLWFLFIQLVPAQNKKLDSLVRVAKQYKSSCDQSCLKDSALVNTLDMISWELKSLDLDSAFIVAEQALALSQKINWKRGTARAYTQKSICLRYLGRSADGLKACETAVKLWDELIEEDPNNRTYRTGKIKALYQVSNCQTVLGNHVEALRAGDLAYNFAKEINDRRLMGGQLGNTGKIYEVLGNYTKANECYFEALKIMEELGEMRAVAINYASIGALYAYSGDNGKAIEYINKGIEVSEKIGDLQSASEYYSYLANVYLQVKNYDKAIEITNTSLKLAKEINDQNIEANNLKQLCNLYTTGARYDEALDAGNKAISIARQSQNPYLTASTLVEIANCKFKMKNYNEAEKDLLEVIKMGNELQAPEVNQGAEAVLYELYTQTRDFEKAFLHYKKYIVLKDSIFNAESSRKQIRNEMNFEYDKKAAILKEQQEKERLIAEEKSFIQKIIIASVALVLIIVLIFTYFVFRSLKLTRHQKEVIELKEKEATEQNKVIREQKHLVEEKQKEILDSINYAKRIQKAHLPTEKYVSKSLDRLKG